MLDITQWYDLRSSYHGLFILKKDSHYKDMDMFIIDELEVTDWQKEFYINVE